MTQDVPPSYLSPYSEQVDASWPLIGRPEELGVLQRLVTEDGARGVVLSGPAGVGKTRLADEALHLAAAAGRVTAWAVANRALAEIPFGAFAHLLPDGHGITSSPLEVLRRTHGELRRRSPDRPLVLGVDDAHLLDDASAGLAHQLVASGTALVVATVRDDDTAPDAVRALWKGGLVERVELGPLSRSGVSELLAAVLAGQVDTTTAHRMWQASEGNVLLLRELVRLGTTQGLLAQRHGVWSWRGVLRSSGHRFSGRLAELIDERLAGLDSEERHALEVLAVGEPLPIALFERVVGAQLLEDLEAAALVAVALPEAGDSTRLAHPLYGEAVRAQLGQLRRRSICRELARAGTGGDCDILRLAGWQLDSGADPDAETLTTAARRAGHLGDHHLAERFARAAIAGGGGIAAGLVLAESLQAQGRATECHTELDRWRMREAEPAERTRWAIIAATNALWGDADAERAAAVLVEAQTTLPAGDLWDELAGHHAEILTNAGRPAEALAVAEPALRRMSATVDTRLRLGRATVLASAMVGRTERAIATADELLRYPDGAVEERPLQLDMVIAARLHAYCLAGRYTELEAIAVPLYERLVADTGSDSLRGLAVFLWGRALLGRGLVDSARARLREAAALLREHDGFGQLPLLLSVLARVEAQLGNPGNAESALVESERRVNPAVEIQSPYLALARAWVASATGEPRQARAHALTAADLAFAQGSVPSALEALHEAVRLGEPALARRLAQVADRVDCAPAADYAAHAAALQTRDGPALDACADRFASHGLILLAAEASIEAAELHSKTGRRAAELTALDRAHHWAQRCEGVRTPVLARGRQAPAAAWLTAREQEIAELATRGLSNADIATRLVLSRRTVGNHLTRIYDKLHVANRTELAIRLGEPLTTSPA